MKSHALLLAIAASLPFQAMAEERYSDPEISYIAAYTFQKNASVFVERCASNAETERQVAAAMDRFKANNPDYVAAAANPLETPRVLSQIKELDSSFEAYKSNMQSMFQNMKLQDICTHAATGLEREVFSTRVQKVRERLGGTASH